MDARMDAELTLHDRGVPRALARERASRVADLRYGLRIAIPPSRVAPIHLDLTVTFRLDDAGRALAFDYDPDHGQPPSAAIVNGEPIVPVHRSGHLLVPASALRSGANTLRFTCIAGNGPLNRRDDHLYTIFVPARAREAFPCFDQPDLKARWRLTLEIPDGWTAVANGADVARRSVDGPDGRRVVDFAETAPLPTYLFAFAAGRLDLHTADHAGRRIRVYHCGADPALLRSNVDPIVDAHAQALAWLEDYTSIPYPFDSFDLVLLPAFQFGGMEHPGAIFYNASALLLPPSATQQQLLGRANVIAHETAHMWFGDLVTMTWFDDVWMKEVFANFLAAKITTPQFPDLEHELRFLHAHYPGAYDVDRTAGANPVRQPLENLADAGSLYGAIVYLKSPVVMRQLELLIGERALRDVLREYLARHRFGNASWTDLLRLLEPVAAAGGVRFDVARWSREWLDEPGRPTVHTDLAAADGRIVSATLHSDDPAAPRRLTWPQLLDVAVGRGPDVEHVRVWVDGTADVPQLRGRPVPDYVLPAGGGVGYGEFRLDTASREWLVAHVDRVADALTRGSAWLTLWDAMLCGDIAPGTLLDAVLRALPLESSELNVQRLLIYAERLFWIFLLADERALRAALVERTLLAEIGARRTATLKAALFACVRTVATTDDAVAWLRAVWEGNATIDGLPLAEPDTTVLAEELAVRAAAPSDILEQQAARIGNDDRRAALAFVAPALSATEAGRDRFFASLADPANRRREPWVIDGMRWLHHPLRAGAAVKYIAPGLELLAEIKRTGDIFLPKRWVDAMLSGHGSPDAAAPVRAFLADRPPTYPVALRNIVLASADSLFRAAQMRTARKSAGTPPPVTRS